MIKSLFPQFKVGEGDTGAINITFSSTASHTVQPTHVNSTTTPERGREDHATVGVGHVRDVPSIIAHTKAGFLSSYHNVSCIRDGIYHSATGMDLDVVPLANVFHQSLY